MPTKKWTEIDRECKENNSACAVSDSISFGVRLLRPFKFLWWPSCPSFVVCFCSVRQKQPIPKEIFDSLASVSSDKSPDLGIQSISRKK